MIWGGIWWFGGYVGVWGLLGDLGEYWVVGLKLVCWVVVE